MDDFGPEFSFMFCFKYEKIFVISQNLKFSIISIFIWFKLCFERHIRESTFNIILQGKKR